MRVRDLPLVLTVAVAPVLAIDSVALGADLLVPSQYPTIQAAVNAAAVPSW